MSALVPLPKIVIVMRHLKWIGSALAIVMATAAAAEESHVRARLVADVAELRTGERFHLGVLLEPEPGWHVYWRNPGEAGLSTEVRYRLPEGFSVAVLQWPIPVEFEQPGRIIGYGYEEPVVLAAEVTAPTEFQGSLTAEIEASWLACKDVCILGSTKLIADLPLKGADLEASKTAFESWAELMPSEGGADAFEFSVTGGPVKDSGVTDLVVWLNWKAAPGTVEFFPDPDPGLKVEGVRVQTRGQLTRIDFSISRLKSPRDPATMLRSLIVIEDERGKRSAWVTHIELD
jgi:DsbC/DsbD-like thiol-disulfide interchange protein